MKREISIASWNVVRATKTWLASVLADTRDNGFSLEEEDRLVEEYMDLLRRLGTLNEEHY